MWRPDIGKYTGHMQSPAPAGAPVIADAVSNVIPQFTPLSARVFGPGLRGWQNDPFNREASYYLTGDALVCAAARTSAVGAPWAMHAPTSDFVPARPILDGVAPTNAVTSTECGDRCAWLSKDMQATALDVEFAFEKARLPAVIADIRRIIAHDLKGYPGARAADRCLSPGYYVFRFGKTPDSLVGMAAGLKQPVYVQQQMLVSRNTPGVPSRYEWVQEAYEQLMLCKHEARPHWGKNWDRTYLNPRCPIVAKNPAGFKALAAAQDKHDPGRVFEPELWRRMVAGEKYTLKPRCQLDRTCYCEVRGGWGVYGVGWEGGSGGAAFCGCRRRRRTHGEGATDPLGDTHRLALTHSLITHHHHTSRVQADEHCADGFACRPSRAFPEYNTCQPIVMN